MKKRILSVLLCFMVILTLLPTAAFSDEFDDPAGGGAEDVFKFSTPENVNWVSDKPGIATWDCDNYQSAYVQLYKDGEIIYSGDADYFLYDGNTHEYDLSSEMLKGGYGDYTFTVKLLTLAEFQESDVSDRSDPYEYKNELIPVYNISIKNSSMYCDEIVNLNTYVTVYPAFATNKNIVWSISDAGTTGATVTDGTLTATSSGTAIITATIADGKAVGTPYTQSFEITVKPARIKLATPTDIKWDDTVPGKAIWTGVDNKDRYAVKLYKNGVLYTAQATDDTFFDFTNSISTHGNYTFDVQAISYNSSYSDSDISSLSPVYVYAENLTAPTGLAWDTTIPGKATWSAVTGASSYSVQLYKGGTLETNKVGTPESTTDLFFDFTDEIDETDNYYFTVTAVGDNTYYLNSASSQASELYSYITPETTPETIFNADGTDSGTLSGVTNGMKYSIDGGTNWTDITDNTDITFSDLTPCTIKVIKKGNGTTTVDSIAQLITITKAETPNLVAVQPSVINGTGSIPTTTAYQFSTDGTIWNDCTGETTELSHGTYYVRVKANGNILTSDYQTIEINEFIGTKQTTPTATFIATGPYSGAFHNLPTTMMYSINGGVNWIKISTSWVYITLGSDITNGIQVINKGDGISTLDSDIQIIEITKASQPTTVQKTDCTTLTNNDGTITNVDTTMEYKLSTNTSWTKITDTKVTDLTNGTYYVRIAANESVLASDYQEITINEYIPLQEPTPCVTFNAKGADCGQLSGVTNNMKYSLNSGTDWVDITGLTDNNSTFYISEGINVSDGIMIVNNGNGTTTIDSDKQIITVTKADIPNADKTDCTTLQNNDGNITGVDNTTMEYQKVGMTYWMDCNGTTIADLLNGTYYVRVKASGTQLASENKVLIINPYTAPEVTYAVTVSGGTGSGSYAEDATVTITANSASEGQQFKEWTGTEELVFIDGTSKTSSTAKFSMPNKAITVTSNYENISVDPDPTPVVIPETSEISESASDLIKEIRNSIDEDTKNIINIEKTLNNDFSEININLDLSTFSDEQLKSFSDMTDDEITAELETIKNTIMSINTTNINKTTLEEIKSQNNDTKVMAINFSKHAEFKLPVNVTIIVDKDTFPTGTYKLYFYNEETGLFEDCGDVVVDKDGKATFTLTHCSDYFISDKDLTVISQSSQQTNDGSNPKTGNALSPALLMLCGLAVVTMVKTCRK